MSDCRKRGFVFVGACALAASVALGDGEVQVRSGDRVTGSLSPATERDILIAQPFTDFWRPADLGRADAIIRGATGEQFGR